MCFAMQALERWPSAEFQEYKGRMEWFPNLGADQRK